MPKQYWPAIILITVGGILLLNQMDLIHFTTADFISYGFILFGFFLFVNGLGRADRKGVLGGVFFLSFGIFMLMMRIGYIPRYDDVGFAGLFLALALANLVFYFIKDQNTSNLVWGIVFAAFGSILILYASGLYPGWYVLDQIERFWPLILIAVGVFIIINAYRKSQSLSA